MKLDFASTAILAQMAVNEMPALDELSPEEARLVFSEINRGLPEGPQEVRAEDIMIPVDGAQIRGRVLYPDQTPQAIMIYYHGGGWVIGDIDGYDALGRHLAQRHKAIIVLVDYRKAPEHKFPIPVDDCYHALNWVEDNRDKINAAKFAAFCGRRQRGGQSGRSDSAKSRPRKWAQH